MVSKSFKLYMYYILSSNCIIKSLKHKLNYCSGRYITCYGVPRCDYDWDYTILNHFKGVFLNHIVAPDWGNVHTFKNNAFIQPLSHSEISEYPELGARLYESFYDILATCQKSPPGVPRGTFSKYGYCIRNMHFKVAPSPKVENIFGKHWNYSTLIFFLAWNIFTSSGIIIYGLGFIPNLSYKTHSQGYCPYGRMKKMQLCSRW